MLINVCIIIITIDLMTSLCKNGLPTGDLFEYAAYVVQNYEKKWKKIKSKETKEKINKYWEEKEKQLLKSKF